jgi:hypothetical protein
MSSGLGRGLLGCWGSESGRRMRMWRGEGRRRGRALSLYFIEEFGLMMFYRIRWNGGEGVECCALLGEMEWR